MSEPETKPERKSIWSDPAALFRGVGGLVGGIAALLTALYTLGVIGPKSATPTTVSTATQAPTPTAAVIATDTPIPTAVPSGTPVPVPAALLEDDFSDASSRWEIQVDSDVDIGYHDGEYRIAVYATDILAWGRHLLPHDWADVAIEVDARWL